MELVVFKFCNPVTWVIVFELKQTSFGFSWVPKPYSSVCTTRGKRVQWIWIKGNIKDLIAMRIKTDYLSLSPQIKNCNILIYCSSNQLAMWVTLDSRDFFSLNNLLNFDCFCLCLILNVPNFYSIAIGCDQNITFGSLHCVTVLPHYTMNRIWMSSKSCKFF